MSRVFRQVYYHVVWSTKGRARVLDARAWEVAGAAIEQKCAQLGCTLHAANAVEDHVHIALEIPVTLAVSDAIGQIKGYAAREMNREREERIQWQAGFGVVTFRAGELGRVKEYIANQQERHRENRLSTLLETCTPDGQDA